jgi:hypothetical protein
VITLTAWASPGNTFLYNSGSFRTGTSYAVGRHGHPVPFTRSTPVRASAPGKHCCRWIELLQRGHFCYGLDNAVGWSSSESVRGSPSWWPLPFPSLKGHGAALDLCRRGNCSRTHDPTLGQGHPPRLPASEAQPRGGRPGPLARYAFAKYTQVCEHTPKHAYYGFSRMGIWL